MTAQISETWGLLVRERSGLRRRTRGLGLGAAVRTFNDLAVPGLGGVWFARPLAWAVLGIKVARAAGRSNVSVANAIEALACWHVRTQRDPRVRGRRKLAGVTGPFVPFRDASRRSFYVTQPMRQGTVQPLRALGFVDDAGPQRFNAFELTEAGERLAQLAFDGFRPRNSTVESVLSRWVSGSDGVHVAPMGAALDPRAPLPKPARDLILSRLHTCGAGAARRQAATRWLENLDSTPSWKKRPAAVDVEHWRDLRAGARFFEMQRAALAVLDGAESLVRTAGAFQVGDAVADPLRSLIDELTARARAFEHEKHVPAGTDEAATFASEVVRTDRSAVMRSLVERDGRGLDLDGDRVVPGPVFPRQPPSEAAADDEDEDEDVTPQAQGLPLPEGVSVRVRALHTLNQDLGGRLDSLLEVAEEAE